MKPIPKLMLNIKSDGKRLEHAPWIFEHPAQQWWLSVQRDNNKKTKIKITTEGNDVAAVCVHEFPRYCLLHNLFHLREKDPWWDKTQLHKVTGSQNKKHKRNII